jgi:hypothetical protein
MKPSMHKYMIAVFRLEIAARPRNPDLSLGIWLVVQAVQLLELFVVDLKARKFWGFKWKDMDREVSFL